MDEILIEEKKYVSSKRAAKITGYAKDYIGQLCREGRVPARLVGRSWYVLESAIHDHRFGNPEPTSASLKDRSHKSIASWEPPRYETSRADILPSINRLQSAEAPIPASTVPTDDQREAPQHLQDSWKTWFDRISDTEPVQHVVEQEEKQPETIEETPEIDIPIHTIYELPPEDLLPQHAQVELPEQTEQEIQERPQRAGRRVLGAIRLVGVIVAVSLTVFAFLGSGYFDEYLISNNQGGSASGIIIYNR